MKNIHILPTEKPSRLFKFANELHLDTIPKDYYKKYNIYITSDEQPKHNDYYTTDGKEIYYCNTLNPTRNNHYKKVIITTDLDLIENGVQAIDDEFLEWFVKNPSCENVEVKHFGTCCGNQSITQCINCEKYNPIYKITIPQEEPKQETLEEYSNGLYKQSLKDDVDLTFSDGVKLGAKWQAERMYSEEELKNAIEISVAKALGVMSFTINEESFKQFKKK